MGQAGGTSVFVAACSCAWCHYRSLTVTLNPFQVMGYVGIWTLKSVMSGAAAPGAIAALHSAVALQSQLLARETTLSPPTFAAKDKGVTTMIRAFASDLDVKFQGDGSDFMQQAMSTSNFRISRAKGGSYSPNPSALKSSYDPCWQPGLVLPGLESPIVTLDS